MVQDIHRRNHFIEALYDNPIGRVVTAGTLALMIAAATVPRLLPRSNSIDFSNLPSIGRSVDTSSQGTGQTVVDNYYSQVRSAILQDVPDLANYQTALDYTAQRMVDMKNVYGLSLDEVRAPIAKWVQANVDWDKKGERLVPFTEDIDFIPNIFINGNFTLVEQDKDFTHKYLEALETHVSDAINAHDQIWADIHDPAKMEIFMEMAYGDESLPFSQVEAAKYKDAIKNYGTLSDKAHWAMVGRAFDWNRKRYPAGRYGEETTRNELPLTMILAVGGDAQIAHGVYVNPAMNRQAGDRQLSIRISPVLEQRFAEDPATYGEPIDHGYLEPNLPNKTAVQARELRKDGVFIGGIGREKNVQLGKSKYTIIYSDSRWNSRFD